MKVMPETIEAQIRVGYRSPDDNILACKNCPSVARCAKRSSRYFCRRHKFYVHSLGYCPNCGQEYKKEDDKPSPFTQGMLF